MDEDLGSIPTARRVARALGKLKNGKAPASSNVLPEMLKVAMKNGEFGQMVLNLVKAVWKDKHVPQEWVDAILILIPKNGNFALLWQLEGHSIVGCDGQGGGESDSGEDPEVGWKGATWVSLWVQERALVHWHDLHCPTAHWEGYRAQSKVVSHIFVDLKKAYDLVPREALWIALSKLGIPQLLIDIISSFHENMKARICVEGELLEEIEVENGLRQGCTMPPTLFNLCACVVAECWLCMMHNVEGVGTLLYKPDQRLFRWYTKNACEDTLHKCEFADDVALLATTHAAAETAIQA